MALAAVAAAWGSDRGPDARDASLDMCKRDAFAMQCIGERVLLEQTAQRRPQQQRQLRRQQGVTDPTVT